MKILIVTHGRMCEGIVDTLGIFTSNLENIFSIPFYVDGISSEKLLDAFLEENKDEKLVVFTDILWGSVNQKLFAACKEFENIHIVTGVNLPILLEIITMNELELSDELIRSKVQSCSESIVYMRDYKIVSLEGDE